MERIEPLNRLTIVRRLCWTVLLIGTLSACAGTENAPTSGNASADAGDPDWRQIADAPLTPRHGAAVGWTGTEVVIVGGDTEDPCPPTADCAYSPTPSADAAAYDPATDSWRTLPDAPARFADGAAAWIGEQMIVVGDGHTFALNPITRAWRRLDPSPKVGDFLVPTEAGLVFVAYDQGANEETPVDWVLDPDAGTWSALPRDPFGESYDRSMAWDGERLWLLSMAVENHFQAAEGAPSRLAILEDDQWRVVEDHTPDLTYEQDMWWHGERLVIPTGPSYNGPSRAFDPITDHWSETPTTSTTTACQAPAAGPGPVWLSGGGPDLVTANLRGTVPLPPCPSLITQLTLGPDLAVWTDEELLVWGADFEQGTTTGLIWTPPTPE